MGKKATCFIISMILKKMKASNISAAITPLSLLLRYKKPGASVPPIAIGPVYKRT